MATPAFLRSLLPFAAYDPPGPFDARQLGFYYVTPPPDGARRGRGARHPARPPLRLAAHDRRARGVSGPSRAAHARQSRADAGAPHRRLPDGGNLLVEGWAFYCEEMMEREGFLAAPAVRLMRLNDQIWRACRVVIDVELHLGSMTFDEAVDCSPRRT